MHLILEDISVRFASTAALNQVSLAIDQPEMIGIIGRSGAGKSTLLRTINRLVEPSGGKIVCDGVDVGSVRGSELRRWRGAAAMIFQQFNLAGRLDVLSNVMVGASVAMPQWRRLARVYTRTERLQAAELLDELDMLDRALERAERLSGGQQQRVAIARALMQEPKLILADEPVASLDPQNSQVVMDTLARINTERGIPVLCNLHDVSLARQYMTRVIGLRDGEVVFDGPPTRLTDTALAGIYGMPEEAVLTSRAA